MAKLKDLFKSKKTEKAVVIIDEEKGNKVVSKTFYIPSVETIRDLNAGRPLTEDQIRDYVEYIKQNYFVSKSNADYVFQYCGEYILFANDERRFNQRASQAMEDITESLADGRVPNTVDALWISTLAYIDDAYVNSKRAISKTIVDDKPQLDVRIARKDPNVNKEISELKSALKKVATKEVANTL